MSWDYIFSQVRG